MADAPIPPPADEPDDWRKVAGEWIPAILAVVILRLFFFEPFRIPSGSMVPTLLIGDHVLVTRFAYGLWLPLKSIGVPFTTWGLDDVLDLGNLEVIDWGDPERGDVIVFHYPKDEDTTYIKRVIGLPGDTLRVEDNHVVLNGELQVADTLGIWEDLNTLCMKTKSNLYMEHLEQKDGEPADHAILTSPGPGSRLRNHRQITVPADTVFVMGDNRDNSEDSRAWGFVRYDQIKGKAWWIWLSWDNCTSSVGSPRMERIPRSIYTYEDIAPTSPMPAPPAPAAPAPAPTQGEAPSEAPPGAPSAGPATEP